MVRLARSEVFDPHEVVVGHLFNRSCRRCFLIGNDQRSGKNFDPRKAWSGKYLQQFAKYVGCDLLAAVVDLRRSWKIDIQRQKTFNARTGMAGFTIVELLVAITIISILMALLIPAVNSARESARRTQCSNNQRNLALATIQYEHSFKHFPGWFNYFSDWKLGRYSIIDPYDPYNNLNEDHYKLAPWHVSLLPYLDAQPIYERWIEDKYPLLKEEYNPPSTYARHSSMYPNLEVFVCPSSTLSENEQASSSYVTNNGVYCGVTPAGETLASGTTMTFKDAMSKWNGPFNNKYKLESDFGPTTPVGPNVTLDDFLDGQSMTVLFSENMQTMPWDHISYPIDTLPHPFVLPLGRLFMARQKYFHGFVWFQVDKDRMDSLNPPEPEMRINSNRFNAPSAAEDPRSARPSSAHVDGVVMAFADGRVQFVNESVDYRVYQALMTLRGKASDVAFKEFVLGEEDL